MRFNNKFTLSLLVSLIALSGQAMADKVTPTPTPTPSGAENINQIFPDEGAGHTGDSEGKKVENVSTHVDVSRTNFLFGNKTFQDCFDIYGDYIKCREKTLVTSPDVDLSNLKLKSLEDLQYDDCLAKAGTGVMAQMAKDSCDRQFRKGQYGSLIQFGKSPTGAAKNPLANSELKSFEAVSGVQEEIPVNAEIKFKNPVGFKECQQYFTGKWPSLYDGQNLNKATAFFRKVYEDDSKDNSANPFRFYNNAIATMNFNYNNQVPSLTNAKCAHGSPCQALNTVLKQREANLKEARNKLWSCVALATMMTKVDYNDTDHTTKNELASSDGRIKCKTDGVTTQDFPACKHFVYTMTSFTLSKKGLETFQGVDLASKNMTRQEEAAKNGTNSMKGALEAQKGSIDDQKKMAEQNAAFHGAKGATLLAMYQAMPDQGQVVNECEDRMAKFTEEINKGAKDTWDQFLSKLNVSYSVTNTDGTVTTGSAPIAKYFPPESLYSPEFNDAPSCSGVAEEYSLFLNQGAKDEMKQAMMQAGLDVTTSIGQATLLHQQSKIIGNALTGLDTFAASVTIPTFGTATTTSDYCILNPNDLACSASSRTAIGMDGSTININGLTAGQTGSLGDSSSSDGLSTSSGKSSTRSSVASSLGSTVDGVSKASGLMDTVGAGSVKDGLGSGNAGGGGSGAPGNTGAASGAGGGDGSGGMAGSSSGKNAMAAYSSGGRAGYSGGLGSGSKRSNSNSNPLSDLLGKKGAANNGDVLDFRNVASIVDKDKDIFKVISGRYETISKDKQRLIQYEAVQTK